MPSPSRVTRRGRRGRRARGPRTPRRVVPRGTAWSGRGPHGPTPSRRSRPRPSRGARHGLPRPRRLLPPGALDEGTAPADHPRVDIFAAHPVERVAGPSGVAHHLRGDDLLDAGRVHLAGAAAAGASLAHAPPAGPPGLRHSPGELAVPAPQVERVHLDVDMIEHGVDDRNYLGAGKIGLLPKAFRHPLADLAVDLGLERLRGGQGELRPEGLLPRRNLRVDLRSDAEGGELPRFELPDDEVREVFVPRGQALADPARIGAERCDGPNSAPSGIVRVAVSDLAEETTEAGVAERPLSCLRKIDHTSRGEDLVHASARGRGLKGITRAGTGS